MNAPPPLLRVLGAATRPEQLAITKGGDLIRRALHEAGAAAVGRIELTLTSPPVIAGAGGPAASGSDIAPDIVVASPLAELARPEAPARETFARWSAYLCGLRDRGAVVFMCTVFRHVPRDIGPAPAMRDALVARIRRLNLVTIDLSHKLGVNVVDIDSRLAYYGARAVEGDFRLNGPVPVLIAGRAIAQALLTHGLDGFADADLQDKALAWLAAPETLPILLDAENLARPRQTAGSAL